MRALVLAVICFVTFKFVLVPVRVEGISMLPTYNNHSIHLVNRLAYLFHEPRRGDVVAIGLKAGDHVMYMKRVIGLPGESVAFRQGRLMINGNRMDEPYLRLPCNWEHEPKPVGPNQYYVVGDNRQMSWEGHEQGRAERNYIVGKVVL